MQHITGLSDEGDGVGKLEGEYGASVQVQVPFALPGEHLKVEVWDRDLVASAKWKASAMVPKWPVFGSSLEVLAPSEHRVAPLCTKFFGACGGCRLQHLAYAQQLRHKQARVAELFSGRSHSPAMQLRDIIGARNEQAEGADAGVYHYRNKMEFTCSTGRWLLDRDKSERLPEDGDANAAPAQPFPFTIGLFPVPSTSVRRAREVGGKRRRGKSSSASWSPRILSIDECALQDGAANRVLRLLAARLEAAGVAAYDFQANRGFLKQLVVRRGVNAREQRVELMIGLVTTALDGEQSVVLQTAVDAFLADFAAAGDGSDATRVVSVVQRLDDQSHREQQARSGSETAAAAPRERTLVGDAFFHDSVLGHTFQVSFDSFFQPNTVQAARLYSEIRAAVAASWGDVGSAAASDKPPVVWDLFCGVGSIGICVAALGAKVVGFEIVEAAVERARANARLNGFADAAMQFFAVDLAKPWDENEWSSAVEAPDVVIVDPPRAGLHRKLVKTLRRLAPPRICYVSCNPETQARDLELLCGAGVDDDSGLAAYDVEFLQPVDMLPHTPHIETIAWLSKCPASLL
ncbi:hypothetical protein PybrP1_006576 [[Pythium] brassicae (nom. inval.)]|nr:hypothetical protein PybrP1_006576 [[Pythium] brassicae (nom. inval.)]